MPLVILKIQKLFDRVIVRRHRREFKQLLNPGAYDFRMILQAVSGVYSPFQLVYLPFQSGVRLLRKASIPSRKSSLI